MVLARLTTANSGAKPGTVWAATERILEKELRYWSRLYGVEQPTDATDPYLVRLSPPFMARAVFAATLTGPRGLNEAQQIVELAHMGGMLDAQQVVDDHARCYPSAVVDERLAPLPSCLAEHFHAVFVPAIPGSAGVLGDDAWAIDAPFHVLGLMPPGARKAEDETRQRSIAAGTEPPPETPTYSRWTFEPWLERTVMHVVRAASSWPHVAQRQLYPLVELYPKAIVMAGPAVIDALAEMYLADEVWRTLLQATKECNVDDSAEWQAAMDLRQRRANREWPPSTA